MKRPRITPSLLRRDRLLHYRHHRNTVGEQVLRAVLRAQASVESAQMCNEILAREGLVDVEIDVEEVVRSAQTVLRMEMNAIMVRDARLPRSAKMDFISRVVARIAPTRDGMDTTARVGSLEGRVRREARRLRDDN